MPLLHGLSLLVEIVKLLVDFVTFGIQVLLGTDLPHFVISFLVDVLHLLI